jgi:hypothetical protein
VQHVSKGVILYQIDASQLVGPKGFLAVNPHATDQKDKTDQQGQTPLRAGGTGRTIRIGCVGSHLLNTTADYQVAL